MKTIYLLFVVFIDSNGYETMKPVSNIKHNEILSCMAEKAHHKEIRGKVEFFCGDETKYFNKGK